MPAFRRRAVALTMAALVCLPLAVAAQRFIDAGMGEKAQYDGRFIFARIRYGGWNSSWNHDYPRADRHLQHIVADLSLLRPNLDTSNVLDLDDPDLFLHPMIYLSEPGFWTMSD